MNKLEINVCKIKSDIFFPHQKININLGQFNRKLRYNDYLGIVYKDEENNIKEIGVLAKVAGIINQYAFSNSFNQSTSSSYVKLEVLGRIKIEDYKRISKDTKDYEVFLAKIEILEDDIITKEVKDRISKDNLLEILRSEADKYFLENNISFDFKLEYNYVKYVFMLCPYLRLTGEYKQKLLEIDDLHTRIVEVTKYLKMRGDHDKRNSKEAKEVNGGSLFDRFFRNSNPGQGNYSAAKSKKLSEIEELEKKLNSIKMPEEARTIASDELQKLKSSGGNQNPEQEWIINYLKTFLKLPWDSRSVDNEDIKETKRILERDHYGLDKVKKRIIEYLSVRKLNQGSNVKKGSILCFNGPPGVGKTSLAKSIAESLGKKFYRLSLGGIRDESEIRGHRRTYVASMPGMIIQALIRAQTKNPVILLDEIDKVGSNFKGDVSSSLLEVLDPEQNSTFKDHYINTPFDLSEVFFICTSNYLENLSPPLRDRLEIIDIPGYTIQEKLQISKRYLIPKQLSQTGLQNDKINVNLVFSDQILDSMVVDYTWESGVRQMERNVASVCRYFARMVVEELEGSTENILNTEKNSKNQDANNKEPLNNEKVIETQANVSNNLPVNVKTKFEKVFDVDENILKSCLGRKMVDLDLSLRTSNPGVAIGLAYTLNGGAITLIESTKYPGRGEVIITGNMGEIMKESITTGLSWIKSNKELIGLQDVDFSNLSMHIHVPQAAVPKDGPSAGITMAISIISLMKNQMTRRDTAMTGEISLQGFVLPVGGIKEKCLAAVRNKIKRVLLPHQNKHDYDELPAETKSALEVVFVKEIKEVIENVFHERIFENGQLTSAPMPKF